MIRNTCDTSSSSFNRKDDAVVSFPIYLLIAIIVSLMVCTILFFGTAQLTSDWNIQQVHRTIDEITNQAETLVAYADYGTIKTIHVSLPLSVSYVVFGGKPQKMDQLNTSISHDKNMTNVIYFLMENGQDHLEYSTIRYYGPTDDTYAMLPSGSYDITMSVVMLGGEPSVKIML
ncbi:MAG: hypothetical protein V1769_03215 [Thermoplasmatota archaeon]